LNQATAPIKHDETLEMKRNMIENASADSLLRFRTENMLMRVASLVPIPATDTGSKETRFAVDMLNVTFKKDIGIFRDLAIK
jgi:hypothetical protein